jgi:hydrogenase expression/formation protein HypC
MCLGLPGRIIEIRDPEHGIARVDSDGDIRDVSLGMLPDESLEVGDWVLVHLGFAMAKIDEAHAAETRAFLNELGMEL